MRTRVMEATMIEFEKRTEKQKGMLQTVRNFLAEGEESGNFRDSLMNLFAQLTKGEGELAQYADMLLSAANTGFPLQLNTLRLFTFYGGEDREEVTSIPKFM